MVHVYIDEEPVSSKCMRCAALDDSFFRILLTRRGQLGSTKIERFPGDLLVQVSISGGRGSIRCQA